MIVQLAPWSSESAQTSPARRLSIDTEPEHGLGVQLGEDNTPSKQARPSPANV